MGTNTSKMPRVRVVGTTITVLFSGFLAFAYGFGIYLFPILSPDMRDALAFTYAEMGYVAAGIQAGFILSSVISGILAPRVGELRFIFASMLLCSICLCALSQVTTSLGAASVLTLIGFVPAATWIPMVAVIRRHIPYNRRGVVFGFLSGSGGYGAIINGQIVPILQEDLGWRGIWMTTGIAVFVLTVVSVALFRVLNIVDNPLAKESNEAVVENTEAQGSGRLVLKIAVHLWAIMMMGAAITITFQTFFTALIRDHLEAGRVVAGRMTLLHGCVGIFAAPLIGLVTDRLNVRVCFVAVATFCIIAGTLLLLALSLYYVALSAIFFGFACYPFLALPPAFASKTLEPATAVLIFAVGNVFVGFGALFGNMSSSIVLELTGNLPSVFAWLAMLATVMLVLILLLPREGDQRK